MIKKSKISVNHLTLKTNCTTNKGRNWKQFIVWQQLLWQTWLFS